MIRLSAIALAGLLLLTSTASAETPRAAWANAKCALCHGMDGSSQTDTGRKVKAPDLRAPATQNRTDEELRAIIATGHKGMPSFRKQADAERIQTLVAYIREIAKR